MGALNVDAIILYVVPVFFFFFLIFKKILWPHPQHMEVPRLGFESEPELPACTTAHGNARSKPHLRPTLQLAAMPEP